MRVIPSLIALFTLPTVAVAATLKAFLPMADIGFPSVQEIANGNVSYWFICLAVVAVSSWTYIGKQWLKQLEQQRNTNAELVAKIFDYMSTDQKSLVSAIIESTVAKRELLTFLKQAAKG